MPWMLVVVCVLAYILANCPTAKGRMCPKGCHGCGRCMRAMRRTSRDESAVEEKETL